MASMLDCGALGARFCPKYLASGRECNGAPKDFQNLLDFKCAPSLARDPGVLGVFDCSKKHAADFEDDHAVAAAKQSDAVLTTFCTPRGRGGGGRWEPNHSLWRVVRHFGDT